MRVVPSLVAAFALTLCSGQSQAHGDRTRLAERADFESLCADLVPVERLRVDAANPEQAAAEKKTFSERRRHRLAETFSIEIAWPDFLLSGARTPLTPDSELDLLMERPFALFDGSVTVFDLDRDRLRFVPIADEIDALSEGLRTGSISLVLHFRVTTDDLAPCSQSRLRALALSVEIVAADLVANNRAVAQAIDLRGANPAREGRPTLTLRPVRQADPGQLPAIIGGLAPQREALERCYAQSLTATPGLMGLLVYDLASNAEGRLEKAVAVADSLLSPMLESCVSAVLKSAKVAPELSGTLVLDFSLQAPAQPSTPTDPAPATSPTPEMSSATVHPTPATVPEPVPTAVPAPTASSDDAVQPLSPTSPSTATDPAPAVAPATVPAATTAPGAIEPAPQTSTPSPM